MDCVYRAQGSTLIEQYADVGRLYRDKIQSSVKHIKRRSGYSAVIRRQVARSAMRHLRQVEYAEEFMTCLGAWSEGANISLEEAMWLVNDNNGCQTAMVRCLDSVILLHTEEDFGDINTRMESPQIIIFTVEGAPLATLVYNDLLPGAGLFGWGESHAVAADSLFLDERGVEKIARPSLANVYAWLVWRNGGNWPGLKDEVADGYALNIVSQNYEKISGDKIIFARDAENRESLKRAVGEKIIQTNIIDPDYKRGEYAVAKWSISPQSLYKGGWEEMLRRKQNMEDDIASYTTFVNKSADLIVQNIRVIHEEIFSRLSEHYVSESLGALCVAVVSRSGVSASITTVRNGKKDRYIEF